MMPTVLLSYLMYAQAVHRPPLLLTVLFVVYGLYRYLYLAHRAQGGERPEDAVFADPPLLATVALWGCACVALISAGY